MDKILLVFSLILFICIVSNKLSNKIGIPILLIFIAIGMIFGADGIFKIEFSDYKNANYVCSFALIFIMFYGGFGTKWSLAKPVALEAILLSSVGTVITAGLVTLFCYYVLKVPLTESFVLGSVISSTDAATVFSILRYKKLNLKYNTASLLELESGSNDPFSYMLTATAIICMTADITTSSVVKMLFIQITIGILVGFIVAYGALYFIKKFSFSISGFYTIFVFSTAIFSFALSQYIGGNGYLSTYITGIFLGNKNISQKSQLVNFFDGVTSLMQMIIFFLLGLLARPSVIPKTFMFSLAVFLFITFVARPVAVLIIMSFRNRNFPQRLVVECAGLRGAASIVFAIVVISKVDCPNVDVFHYAFTIVLLSILLQGSLLPWLSRKLKMIDDNVDVLKTFTDYNEELDVQFLEFEIDAHHLWLNKKIKDLSIPPDTIFSMIIRNDNVVIPNGDTVLMLKDRVVITGPQYMDSAKIRLKEQIITEDNDWCNKKIRDLDIPSGVLIMMIKRADKVLIPKGDTFVVAGDVLVLNSHDNL